MASLKALRMAIKTTIEANIDGLHVYKRIPGSADMLPCVVVTPGIISPAGQVADFNVAMGRGLDTWNFVLYLFLPAGDMDVGQDVLDDYVTGAGAKSIRQAIFNNRTLGLSGTDAHVSTLSAYNQRYDYAGQEMLGAVLHLVVHTDGTAS